MKALRLHNKQTSLLDHSAVYLLLTVMVLWWVKWTTDVHLLNCSSSKTLKKQPMNKKGPSTLATLQSGRSLSYVFDYTSGLISSQKSQAMEPPLFSWANNFFLW